MRIIGINIIIILLALSQPASALIKSDSSCTEHEIVLTIEDWMLEELNPRQESEYSLEDWMFEPLLSEEDEEMQFEDWMFL